jgi:hypothetical protein
MKKGLFTLLLLIITALPALAAPTNTSGPWGIDAAGFKNLSTALASPATAGKTVVVSKPMAINNKTLPTNRHIRIPRGGSINPAAGKIFNYNGQSPEAGAYQIHGGAGSVVGLRDITPQAFGAVGINFADDTVGFEKALLALTRPNAGTYPKGILRVPSGQYKITRKLNIPYGAGMIGAGSGNTIIQVDADPATDGIGISSATADFNTNGEISNLEILSTPGKSRDLITMSIASGVKLDKLNVRGAGRYGINLMDTVGVRGYNVIVSDSGTSGLYVNTASPGLSIATSTAFFGSAFRATLAGYGVHVNGIGIDFNSCYFEYNVGGGINIGSGTVTLTSPYFEGNTAGHNIYSATNADTTLRDSTRLTVINPHMVANNPVDYYALYINGGYSTLLGGGYNTTAKTIYINNANYPVVNMMGPVLSAAPTMSSGTLADVRGGIYHYDAPSGMFWRAGTMGATQSVAGLKNSAATVAATGNIFHIQGTTAIDNLSVPFDGFRGQVTLIPDAGWTTTTAGNIAVASTAVVNKPMIMTYDGVKWYPSY